jgi:hypothetical protein
VRTESRLKKLEAAAAGNPCATCAAGVLVVEEVIIGEGGPDAGGPRPDAAPERCPACGGPWRTREIRDAPGEAPCA